MGEHSKDERFVIEEELSRTVDRPLWRHLRSMSYRIRMRKERTEKSQVCDSATLQVDGHRRGLGVGETHLTAARPV